MASTAHIEPTLTIAPPPRSRIAAAAACETQNVGRKIEPSASSRCSSVCSRNGTGRKMPVLFTRTSTPPKRRIATSTSARASSRPVMWPGTMAVRSPGGERGGAGGRGVGGWVAQRCAAEHHARALVEEAPCGGAADAPAASGDDDDGVLELLGGLHDGKP